MVQRLKDGNIASSVHFAQHFTDETLNVANLKLDEELMKNSAATSIQFGVS